MPSRWHGFRALLLAEPDRDHFHQAAFVLAPEGDVGLDPVHQHDAVRRGGISVKPGREPVFGRPHVDHVHGGTNGRSHGLFG